MILIPRFLVDWITFPGVIVHAVAQLFFCRLMRVAVFDVRFFSFSISKASAYIAHERPRQFGALLLICVGPFLLNSALCAFFCLPALIPVRIFKVENPVNYFWLWVGISIGMHAFPSFADANSLWTRARGEAREGSTLALASFPLVAFIYVLNLGSIFFLDLFYGFAVGVIIPEALVRAFI